MFRRSRLRHADRGVGSAPALRTRVEPFQHARVNFVDLSRPVLGSTKVRMVLAYQAVTLTP